MGICQMLSVFTKTCRTLGANLEYLRLRWLWSFGMRVGMSHQHVKQCINICLKEIMPQLSGLKKTCSLALLTVWELPIVKTRVPMWREFGSLAFLAFWVGKTKC